MDSQKFIDLSKEIIANYTNVKLKRDGLKLIEPNEVYVVWNAKTLQNNKALLSTPISDGMYYELTYNGDKKELYYDAYKKVENVKFDLS